MALRDINIFEKHVEKIVLGAASAGTLFMFYLAAQPVTVEPPQGVREPVTPSSVEAVIHDALGDPVAPPSTPDDIKRLENKPDKSVEESMALIKSYGPPQVRVPDYTALYEDLASGKPLESALVDIHVPTIGAPNFSPQHIEPTPVTQNYALKTPDAPEPELVHAESTQFLVVDRDKINPDNIVLPLPPGTILPTTEKKVVVIDGWIPAGQMLKQMLQDRDLRSRIPDPARQRVVVQDIKVTREEILPSGAVTPPVTVSPPKGASPVEPVAWGALTGADLTAAMDALDAQFKQIVLPDFDRDAQGVPIPPPILTQPVPDKIDNETASLHADIAAAQAGGIVGPTTPPARVPVTPGAGPAAAPATMLPADITQVRQLEVIPFTFWDETVSPGHTYRYHVTVEFVNPVFGWAQGLKNEADKSKTALAAAPITIDKVHVNSDVEFFVSENPLGRTNELDVHLFKHANGRWYYKEFGVPVGARISTRIPTPDTGSNQGIDVDTQFTVVDLQTIQGGRGIGSGGVHVVLRDSLGSLVTRDSVADSNSPIQNRLIGDVHKASTTAPATEPTATTPPGVYIPPTPPRGTPPSPASTRPIPPTPPRGNIPVTPARRGT